MRKLKANKAGQVAKYISRAKAIRKLQLSLKDFRKMCILKGVYPRQPPKKLKKHNRSYYHLKDINFMALDPLITRLRAQKVYTRKYRTAKAKGDIGKIKYMLAHKPKISLNHLVRQRYPDFLDALKDLDDPLTLISLFCIFPTHKQFGLSNTSIEACNTLMKHLQLYIINTHCLKKAFISIKGIYYQLEIMGIKITYITPYHYPPTLPIDVDYRVMCTFLDFYIVLIKFVLFKLYSIQKLEYPPTIDYENNDQLTYQNYKLTKIELQKIQDDKYKIDQQFVQAGIAQDNQKLLFSHLRFYLSSQVPSYSLKLIILSLGGTISNDISDQTITHFITDREQIKQSKSRQYIQPQWVYDSLNFNRLLNVKQYWVGIKLPPHISPFVDQNDTDRYIPQRQKQLRLIQQTNNQDLIQQQKNYDKYDIIAQKKAQKKNKKIQQKQFIEFSKGMLTNKNRKLLKVIQTSKSRKQQIKNKLKQKSQKKQKSV